MAQQQGTPPCKEFKAGTVKAAIWRNETVMDGKPVLQHSIKIQKGYKDARTGQWQNLEMTVFPSEIPDLALVLNQAYCFCRLKESDSLPE